MVFPIRKVPYIIIKENQTEIGLTLALATFSITTAFFQAAKDLVTYTTDLVSGTAGLSPALILSGAAKIVIQAAYLVGLVATAVTLFEQIKEIVFPKVRFLDACRVKDLIEKGCNNIGYQFQSTLLDNINELVLLPVPLQKNKESIFNTNQSQLNQSFTKGYPSASDTTPTLGTLINSMLDMFDARLKVNNGLVQLETKQFLESQSTLNTLPFLNLKDSRQDEYTINSDETWQRYYIHYQTDFSDIHTLDKFEPTDAEYSNVNVNQLDADLNLIKGLKDVNIPFALGVRKDGLNFIESVAYEIAILLDGFTGYNFAQLIELREGILTISQQFFSTTKLLLCDVNNRQPSNYLLTLKASKLWDNYHSLNNTPATNGFKIYENAEVLMNFEEFEQIINNNEVSINGVNAEILEIDFIPESSKATISYKQDFNYSNGKITTFAINE